MYEEETGGVTYTVYPYLVESAEEIRREVFMREQGLKDEFGELDEQSAHVIASIDGIPVATGRVFNSDEGEYTLGRIAVRKAYRGMGIGAGVLAKLEQYAKLHGGTVARLNAQVNAEAFYISKGYSRIGDIYLEQGMPHVRMCKQLWG